MLGLIEEVCEVLNPNHLSVSELTEELDYQWQLCNVEHRQLELMQDALNEKCAAISSKAVVNLKASLLAPKGFFSNLMMSASQEIDTLLNTTLSTLDNPDLLPNTKIQLIRAQLEQIQHHGSTKLSKTTAAWVTNKPEWGFFQPLPPPSDTITDHHGLSLR